MKDAQIYLSASLALRTAAIFLILAVALQPALALPPQVPGLYLGITSYTCRSA